MKFTTWGIEEPSRKHKLGPLGLDGLIYNLPLCQIQGASRNRVPRFKDNYDIVFSVESGTGDCVIDRRADEVMCEHGKRKLKPLCSILHVLFCQEIYRWDE